MLTVTLWLTVSLGTQQGVFWRNFIYSLVSVFVVVVFSLPHGSTLVSKVGTGGIHSLLHVHLEQRGQVEEWGMTLKTSDFSVSGRNSVKMWISSGHSREERTRKNKNIHLLLDDLLVQFFCFIVCLPCNRFVNFHQNWYFRTQCLNFSGQNVCLVIKGLMRLFYLYLKSFFGVFFFFFLFRWVTHLLWVLCIISGRNLRSCQL